MNNLEEKHRRGFRSIASFFVTLSFLGSFAAFVPEYQTGGLAMAFICGMSLIAMALSFSRG